MSSVVHQPAHGAARHVSTFFTYLLLVLTSLILLFPLIFALSIALQGDTISPSFIPNLGQLDFSVFGAVLVQQPDLLRWVLNSFVVSILVTLGVMITSSLAAYAFAYLNFWLKSVFFLIALGTMMIPFEATIVPNFLLISHLGWTDSYQGLVVPFLASAFGIFLLRQYFLTLPPELREAAKLDGCGHLRYLWSFLIPLARPALSTLGLYTFLSTWNQFYWPLLVTNASQWRTTQIGITIFHNSEVQVLNTQMAATLIILIPTLIPLILGHRQLVRGLTAGIIK
ncbi:carbohydrate ABC transporter permease [Ktedonospora formicarum]|uniref:ABC transporter permease n=1 Tax=Ktedonospora formicarum TaxID=2778364 RepID=A0A8J3I4A0_9CHLR|nr:carbohydrate ABC transporter permease [Ktedonospora formicarum]GHO46673.1 ABC transporter permease [Ktedonospora formicarum]